MVQATSIIPQEIQTENYADNSTPATRQSVSLTSRHYQECVEKRGLATDWVLANCKSYSANEASQYLGYKAQSDGIWLKGCNGQGQYKPDKPWKQDKDKKAPKYRSQTGEYDAMLPNHPTDPQYWSDLEALKQCCYQVDGHPCLVITEGFFKAIAGCSNGIPTVALLGVEMGLSSAKADLQGKRYLVPALERFARAGFGFIFAFDADCATNKNVLYAQRSLAHQIKKFKAQQHNATGLWGIDKGKGMDDYIKNYDGDEFKREVLGKVVDIEAWERQFNNVDESTGKPREIPPADIVGAEIAEEYADQLIWNDEHNSWMFYGLDQEGIWKAISQGHLETIVSKILDSKGLFGYSSRSYLTNVAHKMMCKLFARKWDERPVSEILPFTDGVLELATGRFYKHATGHRLTWCLPRPYNAIATGFNKIDSWLNEATGKNTKYKETLIHFAAAVLRGRSDLHKFLHLIGIGGSGKSTFTRLLEALIGSQNCWNGSLQDLEDKHSVADLLGKRLVILPDQDKVTTGLSNFKRLTGQDSLRGRRLYKDGLNFRFPGMAVVTSNAPIFHGGGSWLTRRIVMLAFDHKPAANKLRDLDAEFEPELSAFTSHLLSIPNEEITRVLRGLGKDEVNPVLWQANIRTDSIAAWVNEQVIRDCTARTQIGGDRNEWATQQYNPGTSTLFGSYSHYCRISGLQAKGKNNFSADLIELCQQTLGWDIEYGRNGQGKRLICGLRLRSDGDTMPTLDDVFDSDNPSDNPSDNHSDNLKLLQLKDSDNSDNLLALKLCEIENISKHSKEKFDPVEINFYDDSVVRDPEIHIEQAEQVVREVVRPVVEEVVRDALGIGDTVINPSGETTQIAKLAQFGWLTTEGNYVSHNDLKIGIYSKVIPQLSYVEESALILTDLADDIDDYQVVVDLTEDWSQEHKREVWQLLSPQLQRKYKELKWNRSL